MKPKIGDSVYCIYDESSILGVKVAFLGEDSFITSDFFDDSTLSDSWEYVYDDYGDTWFTDLASAKEKLLEIYLLQAYSDVYDNEECTIQKIEDNYWEIRGKK